MCCFLVSYDAVMKYLPDVLRENSVYANNVPLLFTIIFLKALIEKTPTKTKQQKQQNLPLSGLGDGWVNISVVTVNLKSMR